MSWINFQKDSNLVAKPFLKSTKSGGKGFFQRGDDSHSVLLGGQYGRCRCNCDNCPFCKYCPTKYPIEKYDLMEGEGIIDDIKNIYELMVSPVSGFYRLFNEKKDREKKTGRMRGNALNDDSLDTLWNYNKANFIRKVYLPLEETTKYSDITEGGESYAPYGNLRPKQYPPFHQPRAMMFYD